MRNHEPFGQGQRTWISIPAATSSKPLKPTYDGEWHEYAAEFTLASALSALRLDPSLVACSADVDWVRVCAEDGSVLKAWEFDG